MVGATTGTAEEGADNTRDGVVLFSDMVLLCYSLQFMREQLDTLTDRYAQINYRSEALKADNERLVKLVSSLKGTVNEAEMARGTGMSKETPTERSEYLLEKLNFVE